MRERFPGYKDGYSTTGIFSLLFLGIGSVRAKGVKKKIFFRLWKAEYKQFKWNTRFNYSGLFHPVS